MIRVSLIGGAILAMSAGTLFIAFRSFGKSPSRGIFLIAALLVFVFLCCVVLLRMSVVK